MRESRGVSPALSEVTAGPRVPKFVHCLAPPPCLPLPSTIFDNGTRCYRWPYTTPHRIRIMRCHGYPRCSHRSCTAVRPSSWPLSTLGSTCPPSTVQMSAHPPSHCTWSPLAGLPTVHRHRLFTCGSRSSLSALGLGVGRGRPEDRCRGQGRKLSL